MLRLPLFDESLYRLLKLNAAFANTLGRATAEFLRDVVETLNESRLLQPMEPLRPGAPRPPRRSGAQPEHSASAQDRAMAPARPTASPSVMLLEAEAGSLGLGFFLVENTLPHEVSVKVQASAFLEPPGCSASPRLTFYPDVVTLAPAEQITMRAIAAVDDTLEPGVRYRCELTVPALPGTRIPVVIRRRAGQPVAAVAPSSPTVRAKEVVALKPVTSPHARETAKLRRKRRRSA
jgi:hypothetical protein